MSALRQPLAFLSAEEYLQLERSLDRKSEYVNGEVYAMAGARVNHNRIQRNLLGRLVEGLRDQPCEAFGSNMKVRIERANAFRHPDVSAVCGPIDFFDPVRDAYGNPSLIVEIPSPATELRDRGEKFTLYRLLESLNQFILIHQDRVQVEVFSRDDAGRWESVIYNEEIDVFEVLGGCQVSLGELYERVDFDGVS